MSCGADTPTLLHQHTRRLTHMLLACCWLYHWQGKAGQSKTLLRGLHCGDPVSPAPSLLASLKPCRNSPVHGGQQSYRALNCTRAPPAATTPVTHQQPHHLHGLPIVQLLLRAPSMWELAPCLKLSPPLTPAMPLVALPSPPVLLQPARHRCRCAPACQPTSPQLHQRASQGPGHCCHRPAACSKSSQCKNVSTWHTSAHRWQWRVSDW